MNSARNLTQVAICTQVMSEEVWSLGHVSNGRDVSQFCRQIQPVLVPTTSTGYRRGSRLRTPHDVVVAVPVSRFKLLHGAVLVRSHAGKVPTDGPLPLPRVHHHATAVGPGVPSSSTRASRAQPRSGGFRRRQRGHLAKQIT